MPAFATLVACQIIGGAVSDFVAILPAAEAAFLVTHLLYLVVVVFGS